MSQPNIIYIHSHDTGRYVQPYGYNVPTPNMQQLAEQGVLFRQAFSACPTCSPSRASLLTGRYPHCNGMVGLAHRGFSLNDYSQHVTHALRDAGYRSTLIGFQHIAPGSEAEKIGYDEIAEVQSAKAEHVAPAAVDFLNDKPREPFFVSIGMTETHRAFPEPDESLDDPRYLRPPDPLPDTPETRYDMATYRACVRRLDDGVGAVLQTLDQTGLAERTLVICTTDHGIPFPAMKCHLTDHGTGVMLIMRGPADTPFTGGKVNDAMICQVDLYPTLCELLDIDVPDHVQGTSFLPVLRGETDEVNEQIYGDLTYHACYEPQRSVRTKRYKYIRRFIDRTSPILPNCDASPSKDVWMEAGWRERKLPREMLYDLTFDPHERENLIDLPEYADIAADMRQRLETWMRDTADPLLQGDYPAPESARVNDPDETDAHGKLKPA